MKLSDSVVESARADGSIHRTNRYLRDVVVEPEENSPIIVQAEMTDQGKFGVCLARVNILQELEQHEIDNEIVQLERIDNRVRNMVFEIYSACLERKGFFIFYFLFQRQL